MSVARKLARQQAKQAIHGQGRKTGMTAMAAVQALAKLGESIGGLKDLGDGLGKMLPEAQNAYQAFEERIRLLEYRMDRQRHVNLRMYHVCCIVPLTNVDDLDELQALQQKYEDEYDATYLAQRKVP